MNKQIGIGIIIGLMLYTIGVVSKSPNYSKNQKSILYLTLFLCYPIGLVIMGIMSVTNKN